MPRDPTPLRAGARGAEADAAEDAVDAANAAAAPGDKPPPPSPLAAALLATATKAHTLPDGRALSYVVCGAGAAAAAASDAVGTVLFLHPVQGNRCGARQAACAPQAFPCIALPFLGVSIW